MFRPANLFFGLVALTPAICLVQATGKIEWKGPCPTNLDQTAPMICGTLNVPLDYTDPCSNKSLTLQLAKIAGTEKPRGNSILLNFGGPGEDSLTSLANIGSELQAYVKRITGCKIYILRCLIVSSAAISTSSPLIHGIFPVPGQFNPKLS